MDFHLGMNLDISVLGFVPNGGKGNWNGNVLFSFVELSTKTVSIWKCQMSLIS